MTANPGQTIPLHVDREGFGRNDGTRKVGRQGKDARPQSGGLPALGCGECVGGLVTLRRGGNAGASRQEAADQNKKESLSQNTHRSLAESVWLAYPARASTS